MKPILSLLAFLLWSFSGFGQENVTINDIEIPTAPALMILDNASTNIESPKSSKALTAAVLNGLNNNISVEFTPYFFLKKNKNYYNYNNFYRSENGELKYRGVFSGNTYSNLSVSLGMVKTDTTSNIAIGIKTNLITIASRKYLKGFKQSEDNYKKLYQMEIDLDQDELKENIEYKNLLKENYKLLDSIALFKPGFLLDIAGAYNHFFNSTTYSEGKSGRIGAWVTAGYNLDISGTKSTNYLSFYLYGRLLRDKIVYDTSILGYTEKDFKDFGAKVELEFNNFSFAYEYIKRNEKDNYRSVGLVKYKLYDSVLLQGGFGKNFDQANNLVTFLGISWGLDFENKFSTDYK